MATTTEKPVATATNSAFVASASDSSAELNPKKTADPASPPTYKSDPPNTVTTSVSDVSVKESEGSKTSWTSLGSVAGDISGPVNDIQKKIRRAERFGVPVQLSEQEKRNTRAERFGTARSSNGSEASQQSEELKRNARAERFGLAVPSTATDEEAKKKARLARFAPYSQSDAVLEEKKKSEGNQEAPIAGKAGGGL